MKDMHNRQAQDHAKVRSARASDPMSGGNRPGKEPLRGSGSKGGDPKHTKAHPTPAKGLKL